jgi:quercetin dioxygenase-like cupin family protein
MFAKHDTEEYKNVLPGVRMKTLCYGEKTLMTEFLLDAKRELPLHSHPYEQTGYLVSGHMVMTIDGLPQAVWPGDSWCIPADVEHGAVTIEDSVAIEVFSPVREDYLSID